MTSKRLKYNRTNCPPLPRNTKDHKTKSVGRNNSFRQEDKTVPHLLQQQRKVNRTMKAQDGTIIILVKEGNSHRNKDQQTASSVTMVNPQTFEQKTTSDHASRIRNSRSSPGL